MTYLNKIVQLYIGFYPQWSMINRYNFCKGINIQSQMQLDNNHFLDIEITTWYIKFNWTYEDFDARSRYLWHEYVITSHSILWDVITFTFPRYLLLAPKSSYELYTVKPLIHTSAGNNIVDHSDVVGASPVRAAPTTSSFSTLHLASMNWAKTTAKCDENYLIFGTWHALY